MADINYGINCCGIVEIDDIQGQSPEGILEDICLNYFEQNTRAYAIFSTVRSRRSGMNLATYIRRKGLGTVKAMRTKRNGNTGNMIRMWVWAINNNKLLALAHKKEWVVGESYLSF